MILQILWSLGYDSTDLVTSFDPYGMADNSQYEKERLFEGFIFLPTKKDIFECNFEGLITYKQQSLNNAGSFWIFILRFDLQLLIDKL